MGGWGVSEAEAICTKRYSSKFKLFFSRNSIERTRKKRERQIIESGSLSVALSPEETAGGVADTKDIGFE